MFTMEGEHNEALITAPNPEAKALNQVQNSINHPAFANDERLVFMPDMHPGKGAVVGTTFPLNLDRLRIPPGTVGVDKGCGMIAGYLGTVKGELSISPDELDQAVREAVPMGPAVHNSPIYDMEHDFPYKKADRSLEKLSEQLERRITPRNWDHLGGYSYDYFRQMCERAGASYQRAEQSMGTLGGGNHFVELAQPTDPDAVNELWAVVHSGSRGIGKETAEYWMEYATDLRDVEQVREKIKANIPRDWWTYLKFNPETVSNDKLKDWLNDNVSNENGYIHLERSEKRPRPGVRDDFDGRKINEVITQLQGLSPDSSRDNDLDYLEEGEADGYLGDLNFLQWYARENRRVMLEQVADVLDRTVKDSIECIHNYISFRDGIVRKGATPAREGQRGIVPINMRDGTLIIRGKGNPDWNYSSPHGAGRTMGRREAKEKLTDEQVEEAMEDVYASRLPRDEAPHSYKDMLTIMEAIEPTAEVVDRLVPIHNFKA